MGVGFINNGNHKSFPAVFPPIKGELLSKAILGKSRQESPSSKGPLTYHGIEVVGGGKGQKRHIMTRRVVGV